VGAGCRHSQPCRPVTATTHGIRDRARRGKSLQATDWTWADVALAAAKKMEMHDSYTRWSACHTRCAKSPMQKRATERDCCTQNSVCEMAAWRQANSSLSAVSRAFGHCPREAECRPSCQAMAVPQLDLPSRPTSATSCARLVASPSPTAAPLCAPMCASARPFSFQSTAAPGGGSLQYS